MLAKKNFAESHEQQIAVILSVPLNKCLLEVLQRFSVLLKGHGYRTSATSKRALLKLPEITDEKKIEIISHFENWRRWIEVESSGSVEIDLHRERRIAERALDHYGLSVEDGFWADVQDKHVIEFYGDNMIQLYRNMNFFHLTGYSLMDISVFEWFVLWQRPTQIMNSLMEELKSTIVESKPPHRFVTPRHILRETFNTGMTDYFEPRACLVQFLNLSSIKSTATGQTGGFICTGNGEVVAEGESARTLAFV